MSVIDDNFFVIQGWMRNELNLSGNELFVYAVIYGFSQDGSSKYTGSRQYLADWCGCSVRTIQNVLNDLLDKKLLLKFEKDIDGIKCCEYVAVREPKEEASEKISRASEKISLNKTIISNNTKYNKLLSNDNNYGNCNGECSEFESKMYSPKKKRGKTLYQKCADYINEYTDILELQTALIEYLKFRLNVTDKPIYNVNQWKSMLKKLDDVVAECKVDYIVIVQQSIDKAWLNFYPLAKSNKKDVFAEGDGLSCERAKETEDERKEILEKQGKRTEF